MQCYERQMMYIMLFNHARAEDPEISFDRFVLDQVLNDFSLSTIQQLMDVENAEWKMIINRFERYVEPPCLHPDHEDIEFYHDHPGTQMEQPRNCA